MFRFIAHFQRICHRVQHLNRPLVGSPLLVGVALATDGNVVHLGDDNQLGRAGRQVELLVLLLKIKGHIEPLLLRSQVDIPLKVPAPWGAGT